MEQDRYAKNSKLFIVGLSCLLLSLSLFTIGFYVLPFLLWDWSYSVPGFIVSFREGLKEGYGYSNFQAALLVFISFIAPAAICGYISYFASNYIDNEIYGIAPTKVDTANLREEVKESVGFGLKLFLLVVLVIVALLLLQWLIAPPVSSN